jgi:chorismate-pyruvate lyase
LYKVTRRHLRLPGEALWARRSMFFIGASSILVTEIFLPQVLTL